MHSKTPQAAFPAFCGGLLRMEREACRAQIIAKEGTS
jgi:hypothetical protein